MSECWHSLTNQRLLSHFGLGCYLRFWGLVDLWFDWYLRFSWFWGLLGFEVWLIFYVWLVLRFSWLQGFIALEVWLILRFGWFWGSVDFEVWLAFRLGWFWGGRSRESGHFSNPRPVSLSHCHCHLLEMPAPPTSHLTLPLFVIKYPLNRCCSWHIIWHGKNVNFSTNNF